MWYVSRRDDSGRKRELPHSHALEQSVLGGIMLRNEVLALVPNLETDDFYSLTNKVVFAAIRDLEARSEPIDLATLEDRIAQMGKLDAIGGPAYLGELALRVPTPENAEAYARTLVDHRMKRDIASVIGSMLEEVYNSDTSAEQLLGDLHAALGGIRGGREVPIHTLGDLIKAESDRLLADLDAREQGRMVYAGVPTGIVGIDDRIGGHPIGLMTVYAARPAVGKTMHAMGFAWAAKRIADMDSLICSLEDPASSFGQRGLGQMSGVPTERIRARRIYREDGEVSAVLAGTGAARRMRGELFADCSGMDVDEFCRFVRRANVKRKMLGQKPIVQVFADYLQKFMWPKWARGVEEATTYISNSLARLAATEKMAVVALCQLNREIERRDDRTPRLSDLRGSGTIEQDGKLIFGISHPYSDDPDSADETKGVLHVLKNANGRSNFEIEVYLERETHSVYNDAIDYQRARAERQARRGR